MLQTFRRVATVLLALTFVVSLVPHGSRAADAGVKMIMTAAADMPMSGKCDGCGDDQKAMATAACAAFCASFVALPSIEAMFDLPSVEAFGAVAGPSRVGHTIAPDPHPPRAAVLS